MNILMRNLLLTVYILIYLIFPFRVSAFWGDTDSSTVSNTDLVQGSIDHGCISRRFFVHTTNLLNPLSLKNSDTGLNGDGFTTEDNNLDIWTAETCSDSIKLNGCGMFSDYIDNDTAKDAVNNQLRIFSKSKGGIFVDGLSRSASFMPILKKMLSKMGLPEDLAIVPLIESGYNNKAQVNGDYIAGPWQIMKWTATRFGLKINHWVDERNDPVKSTTAATKYLKLLFDKFGSWELAIAAYNTGEGNVSKNLTEASSSNFWSLYKSGYLSNQVRDYIHKFIAAREIADKPGEYGYGNLRHLPLMSFDTVTIEPPAELSYIAKLVHTSVQRIKELNPELKQWCIPPDVKTYELRIPAGSKDMFLASYQRQSEDNLTYTSNDFSDRHTQKVQKGQKETNRSRKHTNTVYMVKRGDTVYSIAKKKGVPVKTLLKANNLNKSGNIQSGSVLVLTAKNYTKKSRNSYKRMHS